MGHIQSLSQSFEDIFVDSFENVKPGLAHPGCTETDGGPDLAWGCVCLPWSRGVIPMLGLPES